MEKQSSERHVDPRYKVGMRNVKTALSVGICLLFFHFIGIGDGIQAAIAAIICMRSSLQNSIQTGIERIIGTAIGAFLGILALLLIERTSFEISTALAITGVVIIIYLCNIFKVQTSVVIGLVVFLIILIGEKDLPPINYGVMRLLETFFGILVAYLVNKFFDPRHLRKFLGDNASTSTNIRVGIPDDLPRIMAIWLESNISSHNLIDSFYWHTKYDAIRKCYQDNAKVFVYEDNNQIQGFISILDDMEIVGINMSGKPHDALIIEKLLDFAQEMFPCLTIDVFLNNEKLVEILAKSSFSIVSEIMDEETNRDQYKMSWSDKSDVSCSV